MMVSPPVVGINATLAARVGRLFGNREGADCEVAFVREGDPIGAEPLLVIPGHSLVLRYAVDYFMAQVRVSAP